MFSSTYTTLAEALRQIRKEKPKQMALVETTDDANQVVWLYSRPVAFAKV